jgi:large subunit ribosomal protein L15
MLHDLKPKTESRSKRRIGRGGKRGTTSGKGQKGQKARAGHKMRPGFRDQLIRTPKKRGYKNKPKTQTALVVSLDRINQLSESVITPQVLLTHRIIRSIDQRVKIVMRGSISSAKEISGIPVSVSVKTAIEKAGGSIK